VFQNKIEAFKNLPFEGIGLMRIEFILASAIGQHPMMFVDTGESQKFVDKLADGIGNCCSSNPAQNQL